MKLKTMKKIKINEQIFKEYFFDHTPSYLVKNLYDVDDKLKMMNLNNGLNEKRNC